MPVMERVAATGLLAQLASAYDDVKDVCVQSKVPQLLLHVALHSTSEGASVATHALKVLASDMRETGGADAIAKLCDQTEVCYLCTGALSTSLKVQRDACFVLHVCIERATPSESFKKWVYTDQHNSLFGFVQLLASADMEVVYSMSSIFCSLVQGEECMKDTFVQHGIALAATRALQQQDASRVTLALVSALLWRLCVTESALHLADEARIHTSPATINNNNGSSSSSSAYEKMRALKLASDRIIDKGASVRTRALIEAGAMAQLAELLQQKQANSLNTTHARKRSKKKSKSSSKRPAAEEAIESNASGALRSMVNTPEGREKALELNLVPVLVPLVHSTRATARQNAAAALEMLEQFEPHRSQIREANVPRWLITA